MNNPHIVAGLTSFLAMDPVRGIALAQMMADELRGLNKPLCADAEWDKIITNAKSVLLNNANVKVISEFGYASSPDDAAPGTIAVIPFIYPITKYDWWWAGTQTKAAILQKCFDNQNIVAVIELMDTPGGESRAPECYVKVKEGRNKPVYTVVDGLCASAGYWLASGSDAIYTTSILDMIGSIGTMVTWYDFRKYFEEMGIKLNEVYATLSHKKNHEYREAIKGNFKPLIAHLDHFNDHFISEVERMRGDKINDREKVIHGQLHFSEDAQAAGLTDGYKDINVLISEVMNMPPVNQPTSKTVIYY